MLYHLEDLSNKLTLTEWEIFFDNCPKDPYVKEGYRYKRLSWFNYSPDNLRQLTHAPLIQSKSHNPVHGDIIRHYEPLDAALIKKKEFFFVVENFFNICSLKKTDVILVQTQRIDCNLLQDGFPAIEGFHRDGIDWVGLLVISRNNIIGAETQLKNEAEEIIFQKILNPGELLIVNDMKMLHYTTPITMASNKLDKGYRDVIILSSCARLQMGAI